MIHCLQIQMDMTKFADRRSYSSGMIFGHRDLSVGSLCSLAPVKKIAGRRLRPFLNLPNHLERAPPVSAAPTLNFRIGHTTSTL
ncbi:hypothetical protein BRADI_2g34316v3 [Brachypodium distachyon]|uniref:Uncharacterized protein n=1 Tax=Brachypodium distachyon TaxID=15368 RepID=A0A0Q3IN26_BRADI|nr:hypothetical protein BRADI_2g34316v3 [Brachypodium distachyon]